MDWKQLLGSITTSVDEELQLRNAYLDRPGIFIFRLPGSPRDSRVREVGEGASVKTDEGVD
jgi:hypothetical protein